MQFIDRLLHKLDLCVQKETNKKSLAKRSSPTSPTFYSGRLQGAGLDTAEDVKYCKSILKKCHVIGAPKMQEFTNARDYILMYLCIDNASRTGAIANMTIREFQSAILQGDSYRIMVLEHKTLATAGPACIVVQIELMEELREYFPLRNQLTEGGSCLYKLDWLQDEFIYGHSPD